MILELEGIKIGKNRLISDKLVYRRGEDSFLVEGVEYDIEGLKNLFGIQKPKPQKITTVEDKVLVASLVEPPSRILSYHLCKKEHEMISLKFMAIARRILLYYTTTNVKDGKYYAVQPWMLDWDTHPSMSKEFIKESGDKYKLSNFSCMLCLNEFANLAQYITHIKQFHSYNKDKKVTKPEPVSNDTSGESAPDKELEFPCPHCNKVLKSSSGRTNHIKSNHPEEASGE